MTIENVPVTITLKSRFPSDGVGTIEIDPQSDVDFRLSIRIPRWTKSPRVAIGDKVLPSEPGTYLAIKRPWRRGDVVEFSFPFVPEVRVGTASNEGRVAVTAGPLVLALDQADNPGVNVNPLYVALPSLTAAELAFERQPVTGQRSWAEETVWLVNLRGSGAHGRKKRNAICGRLRPYFDAGSWDSTWYVVWLGGPFLNKGDTVGPFTSGHEFRAQPGQRQRPPSPMAILTPSVSPSMESSRQRLSSALPSKGPSESVGPSMWRETSSMMAVGSTPPTASRSSKSRKSPMVLGSMSPSLRLTPPLPPPMPTASGGACTSPRSSSGGGCRDSHHRQAGSGDNPAQAFASCAELTATAE